MKTFKQFIKEQDELGEIDIYAKEPGGELEALGQVTGDGKEKISKFIGKVSAQGDTMITELISKSGFNTRDYHRGLKSILDEFEINWERFADHVQNRFDTGLDLSDIFVGKYGEVDFVEEFAAETNKLLVNPERDGKEFFGELFTLNPPMGNVSVGHGEFLLGIIGNGIKGKVGDVDIIRSESGDISLEVGTWKKIIGDSSRGKVFASPARKIYNICFNKPSTTWDESDKSIIMDNLKVFQTLNNQDIQNIYQLLEETSGPDNNTGYMYQQPITLILGSVVMYDYILGHGDNYIAIINYSSGKSTGKRSAYGLYKCKYCNPKDLGLQNLIDLNLKHNYYNFELKTDGVRIMLGL